jgi:hypothetical protein
MNAPIMDRLNARIAAEPALTNLDTLFVDLQDARDAMVGLVAENTSLKDMLAAPQTSAVNGGSVQSATLPASQLPAAPASTSVGEAITLLKSAKERLAVNALSDVGLSIDRATNLLEG